MNDKKIIVQDYDIVVSRPEKEQEDGKLHIIYSSADAPEVSEDAVLCVKLNGFTIEQDHQVIDFSPTPKELLTSIADFQHAIICRVSFGRVDDANLIPIIKRG